MEWLRSIVLFAAGIGFLEWICPGGVYETYVKFIYSLLMLAVILSPLSAQAEIPAIAELSVQGGSLSQEYQQGQQRVEQVQQLQIREILQERIAFQASLLLSEEFYGINQEDIEVYIQQESLKGRTSIPCTVTVYTRQPQQAEQIRNTLQSGLQLPGNCIRIERKENDIE